MDKHQGFSLNATDGERLRFSGAELVIKASGESTGGAFSIVEEVDPLDTPRHIHRNEDELFFVIEGEHEFVVGDTVFRVGPGATVFAPRGVPHHHKRAIPRAGRFLTMVSPPGFEGFFRDLAQAEARGDDMPTAYRLASEKYEIIWS